MRKTFISDITEALIQKNRRNYISFHENLFEEFSNSCYIKHTDDSYICKCSKSQSAKIHHKLHKVKFIEILQTP